MANESNAELESRDPTVWVADLIFQRHNRTIKYADNGALLILSEMSEWKEIWSRVVENFDWIILFTASILLNFALLACSLSKARRHTGHKKIHLYIGNLAFCNVIFSSGLIAYTFLVDVYYEVDSFTTLVRLNHRGSFASVWPIAKRVIHMEMVENFFMAQSLILLTICIDRYLSLLDGYTLYLKHSRIQLAVFIILPYLLALGVFDDDILRLLFKRNATNIIRLSALLFGALIAAAFIGCVLIRRLQLQHCCKDEPVRPSASYEECDCTTSFALSIIVGAQLVEKFGLFLELLKHNFMFELIVGEADADTHLHQLLSAYYKIAHILFLTNSLYCALMFFVFVTYYREIVLRIFKTFINKILCRKKPPLDYSCETMHSIIAEQNRARQMRATSVSLH